MRRPWKGFLFRYLKGTRETSTYNWRRRNPFLEAQPQNTTGSSRATVMPTLTWASHEHRHSSRGTSYNRWWCISGDQKKSSRAFFYFYRTSTNESRIPSATTMPAKEGPLVKELSAEIIDHSHCWLNLLLPQSICTLSPTRPVSRHGRSHY